MADEKTTESALAGAENATDETPAKDTTQDQNPFTVDGIVIPSKFVSGEGEARKANVAALAKSYSELERRQSNPPAPVVPESVDAALEGAKDIDTNDPRVKLMATEFIAAGLTKEQAQEAIRRTVSNAEKWQPPQPEAAALVSKAWDSRGETKDADHAAVKAWASKTFPKMAEAERKAFAKLEQSPEGVQVLLSIAKAAQPSGPPSETALPGVQASSSGSVDVKTQRAKIMSMMGDERYSRNSSKHDAAFRAEADALYRSLSEADRAAWAEEVGGNWTSGG